MKIAIFTETFLPQVNGVVRTIEKIIHHLEAQGHEALLFAIGDGDDHYSKTPIVRVEGIPFTFYKELNIVKPEDKWLSMLIENDLTQAPIALVQSLVPSKHSLVEEKLKEFKPDLIHLATPVTLGAIGMYYIDQMNLPSLATFHTDLAAYAPRYQIPYAVEIVNATTKMIYSKVDRVLAPSPSSQKQLEDIGLERVGVFGRGVDSLLFDPKKRNRAKLKELGLDPEVPTLLYVGRLAEEKSIPELIRAFINLASKNKVQLLLVGDGPIREDLEKQLKQTGLTYCFAGLKKGEDLAELYASSDIFCFPSKTETFGQVVQEAMASGLAVVGYDSQGVRDLIDHNKTGLLADDEQSFEAAIEQLLKNPSEVTDLRQQGRVTAESRSWQNILDGLLAEYMSLLG